MFLETVRAFPNYEDLLDIISVSKKIITVVFEIIYRTRPGIKYDLMTSQYEAIFFRKKINILVYHSKDFFHVDFEKE